MTKPSERCTIDPRGYQAERAKKTRRPITMDKTVTKRQRKPAFKNKRSQARSHLDKAAGVPKTGTQYQTGSRHP